MAGDERRLRGLRGAAAPRAKAHARRRAARRARGPHRRARRLHARGARERHPRGARHPGRLAPPAARDALRRLQAARAPRAGPPRRARTSSCSTSRPTTSTSSRSAGSSSSSASTRAARSSSRTTSASSTTSPRTSSTSTTGPSPRTPATTRRSSRRRRPSQERNEAEIARAEGIIAEKRAWVERFGAKATKARQAQSRLKQIEKIEVGSVKATLAARRPFPVHAAAAERARRAHGRRASRRRTGQEVLEGVSLVVRRGERVAILGPTGSASRRCSRSRRGTSTPTLASVKWGHETHVGYFPQDHREA